MSAYSLYRAATSLIAPLLPLWLLYRGFKGKEDRTRRKERFGISSIARPDSDIVWFHAASVGEAKSILPMIRALLEKNQSIHILVTTGTTTSARIMAKELPDRAFHQYVPIDTPQATRRFIHFWKPLMAIWVESEFWPNLIHETNQFQSFMILLNGRMSEQSFTSWQKRPGLLQSMLNAFDTLFAQTQQDADRFSKFTAKKIECFGNIKFDAPILPYDEKTLFAFQDIIGDRPLWLAASTHPGEEALIGQAHKQLKQQHPNILTCIVPRHANRGADIAAELTPYGATSLRSRNDSIAASTDFYIADTMGELGLFYRMCETVFMGGSLVSHGGQNPLEPARLACSVITGPLTHNFAEIYEQMEQSQACLRIASPAELANAVSTILTDMGMADSMQQRAQQWVNSKAGATDHIASLLSPLIAME